RYSLMEDQLVIAGDPKSKLWLVREANSGVFHYTQRYFEEMNIQDKKMIVKSNDVIVALLKEGIGRSILSKRSVPENVPMTPLNFHRYFYFIQRTNLVSDQLLEIAEEILRYNESTETSHSEENLSW
ncbi:type 2 periplasmic-binding domain-containing protein, partial [Enterococcus faecium]